jgi:G:T-mismatch repair DNA endonuclease (very short patch repair protein)
MHKLSPKWQAKIASNRDRDRRNFRRLRRHGWRVIRIWEHQIEQSFERCLLRVAREVESAQLPQGVSSSSELTGGPKRDQRQPAQPIASGAGPRHT